MARQGLAASLLAIIAACSSSPDPTLYTLAPVPGATHATRARAVALRQISLAGYLDRPQIVRPAAQYEVRLGRDERWGEPLGGMIERVFAENLVQRLPGAAVFSESGAISARPDFVVEIDIQRLDTGPSGEVVLLAQLAVRPDGGGPQGGAETVRIAAAPASPSTRDLAAAESAALGELSDRVAARIGR